ncbi:MAG: DNA polymerase Y family protein [Gammaproteobacteria bacterium]|nr:DNA polymerase Y family protein [Gammaproteobacteria bacterium]
MATDQALAPRQEAHSLPSHERQVSHAPLWLCVYFPNLPLEVFTSSVEHVGPMVVLQQQKNRCVVRAVSPAAEAEGVCVGMPINAAYALCHQLDARLHNPKTEVARLKRLAAWAGQFTPMVSLEPPQALLLEVKASMKLFGGLEALCRLIGEGLSELGHEFVIAVSPTPIASWFMARNAHEFVVTDKEALRSVLGELTLTGLGLDARVVAGLHKSGLRTLRDVWRLPREGLARRFGCGFLNIFDRALGLTPDPRKAFVPPERFASALELPAEISDTELLLIAIHRLQLELAGFLRARDAGVDSLTITLHHARRPASSLQVGMRHNSCDADHLLLLIRERFEHLRLPASVIRVTLTADEIHAFTPAHRQLFDNKESVDQDWDQVLEQLQARLGEQAVRGVQPVMDHRPERAWSYVDPGEAKPVGKLPHRPLWLLPQPQALALRRGRPWRQGKLRLQQGPERIEGGWWDDADICRDYYVAIDRNGSRLWIFRDLVQAKRWYLHGWFS